MILTTSVSVVTGEGLEFSAPDFVRVDYMSVLYNLPTCHQSSALSFNGCIKLTERCTISIMHKHVS